MIEVDKGQRCRMVQLLDADLLRRIRKLSMPKIMKEYDPVAQCYREIGMSITVVVAHRAGYSVAVGNKSGRLRWDLLQRPTPQALVDADRGVSTPHHHDVFLLRALNVKN